MLLALAILTGCVEETTAPTGDASRVERATTPVAAMEAEQATQQVLAAGTGWRLLRVAGVAIAADGSSRMVEEEVLVADSLVALDGAPVPPSARGTIRASFLRLPTTEQHGPIIVNMAAARQVEGQVTPQWGWPKCEAESGTWSRAFATRNSFTYTQRAVTGSFQGQAVFAGSAAPNATASANFNILRSGVWPVCVPTAVTVKSLSLSGGVDVRGRADIKGAFEKEWRASVTVISPRIFAGWIWFGPVPVLVTVDAPIDAGIEANAKVSFEGHVVAEVHGDFSVDCGGSSCSTTKNIATTRRWVFSSAPRFDARATVIPFVEGGLRVSLYADALTGQVGLRAMLKHDVWAYVGNTCGDANNDGTPELVKASTLDARLALALTAKLRVIGLAPANWSWPVGSDYFVGFYDLIGSTALDPIFYVSGVSGTSYTVTGRMRPCWPYADPVVYGISWGDNSSTVDLRLSPRAPFSLAHVFPSGENSYVVKLTARRDVSGRVLNRTVAIPIKVGGG